MLNIAIYLRLVLVAVFLCSLMKVSAQIGAGLRFGGNLSQLDGDAFRSAKKVGLQAGLAFHYNFSKNLALQVEPSFNISRVRANESTAHEPAGIAKGTKSLSYFQLPVFAKLCITRGFSLMVGPEFSHLLNESRYRLNNNHPAFKDAMRIGYSVGLELGAIYFRYHEVKRVSNVYSDWHAALVQYQLGIKWDLF